MVVVVVIVVVVTDIVDIVAFVVVVVYVVREDVEQIVREWQWQMHGMVMVFADIRRRYE